MPIPSKLPRVGTTIFTVMSQLATEHNAINLSQGFPDFETDSHLIELVNHYMKKGFNQYAPMPGLMLLREQIAQKINNLYQLNANPDTEITITAGGTQAIFTAITALVKENDEVILFEPAYDSYVPAITLAGAKPIYIPLEAPEYKIPWEAVKRLISPKTRLIIINTPHNPTGTIWQEFDTEQLRGILKNSDINVISDEVYEHLIFDGLQHHSLLKYPDLFERSVVAFSFGKTFHNTGWKIGYAVAPQHITTEIRKIHQYLVFSVNTPIQYAFAEYLKNPETYTHLSNFYAQKRNLFLQLLSNSKFSFVPSKGTYFQLLNYANISTEKDTDFAIRLTKQFKVAAIPLSVFYSKNNDNKILRFCFAKKNTTLEKAAENLCKL